MGNFQDQSRLHDPLGEPGPWEALTGNILVRKCLTVTVQIDFESTQQKENAHIILYDKIRYDMVHLRALKSSQDGQLNLAHGPETKNKEKIKTKTEQLRRNGPGSPGGMRQSNS